MPASYGRLSRGAITMPVALRSLSALFPRPNFQPVGLPFRGWGVGMPGSEEVLYWINDRDEIIFVSESWDRFAARNAGDAATSAQVLHRSLWDFLADPTTRELYRQVLVRIRAGHQVRFTFRCDSPACRRLLEMSVQRDADGCAEFRSRTLSMEERPAQPLGGAEGGESGELLRVCGWCKKVDVQGRWTEVEDAVDSLRLMERATLPAITHGICEECHARVTTALRED